MQTHCAIRSIAWFRNRYDTSASRHHRQLIAASCAAAQSHAPTDKWILHHESVNRRGCRRGFQVASPESIASVAGAYDARKQGLLGCFTACSAIIALEEKPISAVALASLILRLFLPAGGNPFSKRRRRWHPQYARDYLPAYTCTESH